MSLPGDPVYALATPPRPARRAVIRLTGRELLARADAVLPPGLPRPRGRREARTGALAWLPGCRVPAALLVFPGPGSATGEDVLEIHLPSSLPVLEAVQEQLRRAGLRPAEPGEFTRRAFRNGRLDLVQAEAVLDLVHARSAGAAAAAAAVLAGGLGRPMAAAREALAGALTELEASLDFEEGDTADLRPEEVAGLLREARRALAAGLDGEERRTPGPAGLPRIGLAGPPNAGKSTLFARLTGRRVLVSGEAGTTRDLLEGTWRPPGLEEEWLLVDGPGRGGVAADPRDAAARKLATRRPCDLWWWLGDVGDPATPPPEPLPGAPLLVVWNQRDRPRRVPLEVLRRAETWGPPVWISARTGAGLAELARRSAALLARAEEERAAAVAAGARHRAALRAALECLERAEELHATGAGADLVAEELRAAIRALEELAGRLAPKDLLDRIFSRFCIGK